MRWPMGVQADTVNKKIIANSAENKKKATSKFKHIKQVPLMDKN